MKIFFATGAFIAFAGTAAYATPISTNTVKYANTISIHNIVDLQHSISSAVFNANDYYGTHVGINPNKVHKKAKTNASKLYGTAPLYGTMPLYGEWNDDGTATIYGRNGGDMQYVRKMNAWLHWNHTSDKVKFNNIKEIDTKNDLIIAGIGTNGTKLGDGMLHIGAFAGYTGGRQQNRFIKIDANGGYFGAYGAYDIYRARISATATIGSQKNKIPNNFGGDKYTNTWANMNIMAAYDILIDPTFTLQPGLGMGYTWAKSDDYVLLQQSRITNDNLNIFEITPSVRAIKNIANDWYGAVHARYVFKFDSAGTVHDNGTKLADLNIDDYAEYGLGLEKSFGPINASLEINRRDGARRGWNGGARLKMIF